mmetsp:Transcript_17670/g.15483  ORF Transcript_17670/g.15483 Transcript_17670/m.15483 type:complete len:176 (-) Transcript_17670:134-661(-)
MTSVTNILAAEGVQLNGQTITPASFNNWLKSNNGFASGNLLMWGAAASLGLRFDGFVNGGSAAASALNSGKLVVLNVRNGGHWVLAVSSNGSTFTVRDPGYQTTTYSYSDVGRAGTFTWTGGNNLEFDWIDFEGGEISFEGGEITFEGGEITVEGGELVFEGGEDFHFDYEGGEF